MSWKSKPRQIANRSASAHNMMSRPTRESPKPENSGYESLVFASAFCDFRFRRGGLRDPIGVWSWFLLTLMAISVSGCGGAASRGDLPAEFGKLRDLAAIYVHSAQSMRRPPRGWEDLAPLLEPAGISDPEAFFRSTRDGQPFVVIWDVDVLTYVGSDVVLAYERRGSEGKRWIVYCSQRMSEVSEDEFRDLQFPRGHEPAT